MVVLFLGTCLGDCREYKELSTLHGSLSKLKLSVEEPKLCALNNIVITSISRD